MLTSAHVYRTWSAHLTPFTNLHSVFCPVMCDVILYLQCCVLLMSLFMSQVNMCSHTNPANVTGSKFSKQKAFFKGESQDPDDTRTSDRNTRLELYFHVEMNDEVRCSNEFLHCKNRTRNAEHSKITSHHQSNIVLVYKMSVQGLFQH